MSSGTIYGPENYHKCQLLQVVAKYSGKSVKLDTGKVPSDKVVPANITPVYVDGDVTLFEPKSIAFYLANDQLKGGKLTSEVLQWTNLSDMVLLPAVGTLVLPCLGLMQFNKNDNDKANKDLEDKLKFINAHMATRTYLVGERITLADLATYSVLKSYYEMLFDEPSRRSYSHLNRWMLTMANQENVLSVFGEMKLCETPAVFDHKKYAELHPSAKKEKQAKPAKQETKKAEKKVVVEEVEEAPKKKEDPFALLPKGNWDMDEWKRTFSNNDVESVALPYFWQHFDKEHYSLWECEYLYPKELNLLFMTCNLVGGMFQRLDRLQKHAFASMCIVGEDKNNTIKGLWLLKGTELAFTLSEDCQVDYESYSWGKLDPESEETKAKVLKFFTGKGDFGQPLYDIRIFK